MSTTNHKIPRLAVSVALRHRDDGRFLLVKRGRAPSKGMWAFAGGRVEFGETMEDAARRELMEETGLLAEELCHFDQLELIQIEDLPDRPAHHYLLTVHTGIGSGEPIAADDADEARWLSLEQMDALPVTTSTLNYAKRLSAEYPVNRNQIK